MSNVSEVSILQYVSNLGFLVAYQQMWHPKSSYLKTDVQNKKKHTTKLCISNGAENPVPLGSPEAKYLKIM